MAPCVLGASTIESLLELEHYSLNGYLTVRFEEAFGKRADFTALTAQEPMGVPA
jgi:hypothetical protein